MMAAGFWLSGLGSLFAAQPAAAPKPPAPRPVAVMSAVVEDKRSVSQIFDSGKVALKAGRIDELVFESLKKQGVQPATLCTDEVFLRRAYLDAIGTLPTPEQARAFIADKTADKRLRLVDQLLQREEYAEYWALKWSDLLRVKAEFPINLWPNAAQLYHHWIRDALRENMPMDQFARSLLTSNGSNFRTGPVNFYRAMQSKDPAGISTTVALGFLGARLDKWPEPQRKALAVFFSQLGYKSTGEWKEEIVYWDRSKLLPNGPYTFPDGKPALLNGERDPRIVFTDWLLAPGNPVFARVLANRAWSWLMGRGIVQEPDDFRADNPPVNPELLDYLASELVKSHYDIKQLFREILKSQVYQFSSVPSKPAGATNSETVAFASYPLRRLEAEVLIDAINQITGGNEHYSSPIPEPFTYVPENARSISLHDGSITSSFLEMFGKPARDTGLESERNNKLTPIQSLHLLNSTHIRSKLEQGWKLQGLMKSNSARENVDNLYLSFLSRFPTDEERRILGDYARESGMKPREIALDIAWALVNSDEFLLRH